MTTISHVHASGRFNQSPTLFHKELDSYRKISSIVTLTEVDNNARARLLRGGGWNGVWGDKGPRDDCGVTWDTAVWEEVWSGTITVSKARYKNDRGWMADTTEAAYAVLRNRVTNKTVVWGSLHTPHGMQEELRSNKIRTDVAVAYVAITNGFRRHGARLARKYKADAIALSGDWNLNIRSAWVRAWFKRYTRTIGLKLNWTGNFPSAGTHGKEIIDATLYKGMNMKIMPKVLPKEPGNDHTGYVQAFSLV